MRDSRSSRNHARILVEHGEYVLEDLNSRHGTFVNGNRIQRRALKSSDRIEFGSPDSYQMIFTFSSTEMNRLLESFPTPDVTSTLPTGPANNLAKLRAVMEVARALQTSLSTLDILTSVVDAALAVTDAERGFLLLRRDEDLEMRVARDRRGTPLSENDLKVPRRLIDRALQTRRELLSMSFDPSSETGMKPEHSVADLELRSVVCVPLVRIRVSGGQETSMMSTQNDTVGVLYMDSRLGSADMSAGNRELLQTLALEASTILENARLLEEERTKHKMEEELGVARLIQKSLAPRCLPEAGWFRAWGSSEPSHQVGGDYFDVIVAGTDCWAAAVADVSGKGVSSALLASYLQGALSTASSNRDSIQKTIESINRFLGDRAEAGKYATIFYSMISHDGSLHYINAGHCAPLVVSRDGSIRALDTTGFPVGLVSDADFPPELHRLKPGDRVVCYTDGVSEAQGESREFYGLDRLRAVLRLHPQSTGDEILEAVLANLREFTGGAPQSDDVTLLVLEYQP
jgi:serine phosphatase RsbU (regulator of sigma subunit)